MQESFFDLYLRYAGAGVSEPPITYHRWVAISIVGALLGRRYSLPFGHSQIYPNQYINLMGQPGTRKSTAINIGQKLLKETGFTRFAADRVSKEKFIMEMQQVDDNLEVDELMNLTLDEPAESYVVAEEFTDFIGSGNIEFITLLTKLWDNLPEYKQPKIHGQSVTVIQPTVNILAGNTAQNFAVAFPPEALGNGYMSRTLFIHGDSTGRKITFPPKPDALVKEMIVQRLLDIKAKCIGEAHISDEARTIFERIYKEYHDLPDSRFNSYSTRRLTHIFKLCLVISASKLRTSIEKEDVLEANTILHWAECRMPKALGEYGKSKLSSQTATVMDVLYKTVKPMNIQAIWKHVAKDFTKMADLTEVIRNLLTAGKIQDIAIAGHRGYLPKHEVTHHWADDLLLPNYLTDEEMTLGAGEG